jgi:hypothetical protein
MVSEGMLESETVDGRREGMLKSEGLQKCLEKMYRERNEYKRE